ncbi:MAG TPA: MFS transporter, partial [Streptosporangiaceae bacterium]|nr:MFS transporter [Streptosporangiaceae bacterium]
SLSRLRRSLRASTAEGLMAEVVGAFAGGAILTGWAIHLHASALLTGIVVALPQMAQLFQFPAAWTTAFFGRRRAAVMMVAASRQVMLPLLAIPLLAPSQKTGQAILLAVAAISAVLGVLGNNAWVSWMGDLVPRRIRGRYFGQRTALCTIAGAAASAAAGVLLDRARSHGWTGTALALLQLCASGSGVVTTILMLRQHDPAPAAPAAPFSIAAALSPLRDRTARGLLVYALAWNLAVGLAGSFFALYMLQNLHMGFTLVAVHGIGMAAARVLTAPLWGRVIDRLGARPVLAACAFGISVIPLVWLFPTPTFLWPLIFDAVLAGVLWGGHNLAMFVVPMTTTPQRGRPFYIAAIAMAGGLTFSVATACGGALAEVLPRQMIVMGHPLANLQVLVLASAVLRFAAAFVAVRIHEPAAAGVSAVLPEVLTLARRQVGLTPATTPRDPDSVAA